MQVFLAGQFVPRDQAKVDIEDRGVMFADGVYEVVRYYNRRPLAMAQHLERLKGSMAAIGLPQHPDAARLDQISDQLVHRNDLPDARVYWQVTRGIHSPRTHDFPKDPRPTVLAIAWPDEPLGADWAAPAIRVITTEDLRWHQCWIKSIMLLPNVMAKSRAREAGAAEAILVRNDVVTEGTATSVFIVRDGELWTHPANHWILASITRQIILGLSNELGITCHEKTFSPQQLLSADEVLLCGTTTLVAPVIEVDGQPIGSGNIGPVTKQLGQALVRHIRKECEV